MSIKTSKTIFGDNCFVKFSAFRINPDIFLDRQKLTKDGFCLDLLKDLYSDHVEIQSKIHLLLLLQEFSTQFITNINLLEQIIESLTNLFYGLDKKSEKSLLKNHILVAIVTILLASDLNQDISSFVLKVKVFLLKILYDSSEASIVTGSACSCLEELETFYPELLQSEIENFLTACERETSPAFQNYALLLNTCAKQLSENKKKKDILEEENKDLTLTSTSQISSIISSVLELLPLLSYTSQYRVFKSLITIVQNTSEFSPKTFKLYLNNLVMSSEVPVLHFAFDLQNTFGSNLFTDQDQKQLLKQFIKLSVHPCLTSSHRLLFLDWLQCLVKYNKKTFALLSPSDFQPLLPSPFDGPLTQEKKAKVLALCIPTDCNESFCGDFLNEATSGLVKCSLLFGGTKAAPSLFRTLFTYFSTQNSEIVYDSIYKLLVRIMKTSLHLTPYALSFIDSAKYQYSDRNFHEKALDHMVEHILSVSVKQFHSNLDCYLTILERAAQESSSTCKPRAVLRLLQKLFNNVNLNLETNWCSGNNILSLCRSLMKHHDVQIFYYDLAEVLCIIIQQFCDVDVKDRAKIYYSILTSLSKFKVQTLFNLHSSESEGTNTIHSFVTSSESSQFACCIQKLSKPVLELIRTKDIDELLKEWPDTVEEIPNILEIYLQHITTQESLIQVPLNLKHVSDIEDSFSELFSIVITTQSDPLCQYISDLKIPVLYKSKKSNDSGKTVLLQLKLKEPQPLTLHSKAEFTCRNGLSYSCHLPFMVLDLKDLFLPLPVPEKYSTVESSWRKSLFEVLWESFIKQIKEETTKCCLSVFALKIKNEEFSAFVEKKWKHFIVSKLLSEYHIAIHLPPQNHLLLKISIVNNEPFVNILVDNSSILPWITLYFQNINEQDINLSM